MNDELNDFFEAEQHRAAESATFELGLELALHESTGQVLEQLCMEAEGYLGQPDEVGDDISEAMSAYFALLHILHDGGGDIASLELTTVTGKRILQAVNEAVASLDSYKIIVNALFVTNGDPDTKLEDELFERPLGELFDTVCSLGKGEIFWLSVMRKLMPRAKILDSEGVSDHEVIGRILNRLDEIYAEDDMLFSRIQEDKDVIIQVLEERIPGVFDARTEVIRALRMALMFRRAKNMPSSDAILEKVNVPIGISHESFSALLRRCIEIADSQE
jgi:hypothetical protein